MRVRRARSQSLVLWQRDVLIGIVANFCRLYEGKDVCRTRLDRTVHHLVLTLHAVNEFLIYLIEASVTI